MPGQDFLADGKNCYRTGISKAAPDVAGSGPYINQVSPALKWRGMIRRLVSIRS